MSLYLHQEWYVIQATHQWWDPALSCGNHVTLYYLELVGVNLVLWPPRDPILLSIEAAPRLELTLLAQNEKMWNMSYYAHIDYCCCIGQTCM